MLCPAGLAVILVACSPTQMVVGAGATVGLAAAQDRGISGTVEDTRIRLEINEGLLSEDFGLFQDIHLQVQHGRVLLSGSVPDEEARVTAVRIAWQAEGVREVINEIEVRDDQSVTDFAQDRWIEVQLRAKLLGDREVSSLDISIESVDQSVYLIGVARSQDEIDRVVGHAKDVPYVRRVVSHVNLKGAPEPGS